MTQQAQSPRRPPPQPAPILPPAWGQLPAAARQEAIRLLARLLREHRSPLASADAAREVADE